MVAHDLSTGGMGDLQPAYVAGAAGSIALIAQATHIRCRVEVGKPMFLMALG